MPEPPPPADAHRAAAPLSVRCAVLTVSDTRTQATDRGGATIAEMLEQAGHGVAERRIVPDDPAAIRGAVQSLTSLPGVDALLLTGGTGIAPRDNTIDTLVPLFSKTLPGYGELFRMLSYQEIQSAAMLSRATGGVIDDVIVLSMPGSTAAVRLAMQRLILPELGHLVGEARKHT